MTDQLNKPDGLVVDRIRQHAERLVLNHLAVEASALAARPRPPSWATWTSSTSSWKRRSAFARAADSATR
jgi:hypothetical protein